MESARFSLQTTGKKQRLFASVHQGARSRGRSRRVIVKAEHSGHGPNPRYVVTHLPQTDKCPYDKRYCTRDDMENRTADQQMDLFAGRAPCPRWWPNPFRQRLSGLADTLLKGLRVRALKNTAWARASPNRIRLRLLKVGAVIIRNSRRIRLLMSSACPHQELFRTVVYRLNAPSFSASCPGTLTKNGCRETPAGMPLNPA